MEITVLEEKKVNLKYIQCQFRIYDWKSFIINGKEDNNENPETPYSKKKNEKYWYWCPFINVDAGMIVDWPQGTTLEVYAKTCDENILYFLDEDKKYIEWFDEEEKETLSCYDDYVPEFLDTVGDGCGDYIQLTIDKNGHIKDFNKEEIINIFEKENC